MTKNLLAQLSSLGAAMTAVVDDMNNELRRIERENNEIIERMRRLPNSAQEKDDGQQNHSHKI